MNRIRELTRAVEKGTFKREKVSKPVVIQV
jgi:hypothetical protein